MSLSGSGAPTANNGVRAEGRISLGGCQRNRVQAIPIQAKGRNEMIGAVQAVQDLYCCREKFPQLICRAIAAQTISIVKHSSGVDIYTVGLMELGVDAGTLYDVSKIQERHFELVLHADITSADLAEYKKQV